MFSQKMYEVVRWKVVSISFAIALFDGEVRSFIEIMEEVPEEPKTPTPPPKTPTPPPPKTPSPKPKEEDEEAYKKRWGPRVKDTSLEDERERQRIAEERRRKAALLFEKLRGKKYKDGEDDLDDDEGINFDECE
jgi:type IV secretory pathway VirB10-like protein